MGTSNQFTQHFLYCVLPLNVKCGMNDPSLANYSGFCACMRMQIDLESIVVLLSTRHFLIDRKNFYILTEKGSTVCVRQMTYNYS